MNGIRTAVELHQLPEMEHLLIINNEFLYIHQHFRLNFSFLPFFVNVWCVFFSSQILHYFALEWVLNEIHLHAAQITELWKKKISHLQSLCFLNTVWHTIMIHGMQFEILGLMLLQMQLIQSAVHLILTRFIASRVRMLFTVGISVFFVCSNFERHMI